MKRARQVILLADSSKVGKIAFAKAGQLKDLQVLITDKNLEARVAREIRKSGVTVVQV